ncbi:MAG TPA: sugar phosphate nucleotidyltransferase [Vicinamibacterales bacterium]|jgi:NDP-sugar pyrophosphorylase family protein|nr:sugar phosphate nucleotidyltransferase [Vicinamibacterales bacterium]
MPEDLQSVRRGVILAGGLGERLRPFTDAIPKSLLPIGEQSLLEIQIDALSRHGFREIIIATNYKSDYIEKFIGDGSKYGVRIIYSRETMPLGTCGPLSLVKDRLTSSFLVMNGDILTTIDFDKLYTSAGRDDALLTVVTKQVRTPFNFGSVDARGNRIVAVSEKPDLVMEVLAGIYIIKPELLPEIPVNSYFGMDTLISDMIGQGRAVGRYLMSEYWLDIGKIDDYRQAQSAYREMFSDAGR